MDVWIYVFLIEKTIVIIGYQVGVTSLARLSRGGGGDAVPGKLVI